MFANLKADIPASIVVFLVAMPLCLGIALASGAPLYSGIISGIVGGIVVGSLSGSSLGVSGPAAGLAVIILTAIGDLGAFDIFLVSVILAGIIQVIMGFARAGIIGYFFPSSVIHGMLAGIGILIFLKQLPHAFGYDADLEGDQSFIQADGHNTFSELYYMLEQINPGSVVVTAISLVILILWDTKFMKNLSFTKIIPGPLVAVATGITLNNVFSGMATFNIEKEHLVNVPVPENFQEFLGNFVFPNFSGGLTNPAVYTTAIVIAVVASLETLLSLEATDQLDPMKRVSPANRELKAQGIGNIVAGFIGGIPVTQVIVRSSANVQSGGKTKASAILHGIWLLLSILLIPSLLNQIPLATLAAVLLLVGYKLAKPELFRGMFKQGWGQFLPFVVTIVAMLFSDLLKGIGLGMLVAVFVILRNNLKISYHATREHLNGKHTIRIKLSEDITFLNKASIRKALAEIEDGCSVIIDASNNHFIHYDVIEIIEDFQISAKSRDIDVEVFNLGEDVVIEPMQHFEVIDKKI